MEGGFKGIPSTNEIPWSIEEAKKRSEQFTGLHDRNKKEIYEGDILAPMSNDFKPDYKNNWIVIYEKGTFIADREDKRGETWIPYWDETELEVIGNIHENPEFLKGD